MHSFKLVFRGAAVSRPVILIALGCGLLGAQDTQSKYELPPDQRTGVIRRISVLCHSHLDIGFTRPPDEVARGYKDNIDAAIRLTRENPDFRWTIESAWMLEEWLRRTDDESLIAELGAMLRDGRMSLGMAFASMHSGLMAAEESNRLVYLGEKFRRKFGIRGAVAFQNDVPGFTWAYPRIFAGSGVTRLITGLNLFIGGGNNLGVGKNPFYWEGPDGSRVLTFFTYESYVEGSRWKLGGRFPIEELERSVPRRLAWLEKNGYKYDTYLLMTSAGDNIHPSGAFRTLQRMREWNRKHPELPMKMVTAEEFFDDLIARYGDHFASASGDAAGFWENVKLKVPEAAAKMRQAANDLPAAETASAIAALTSKISFPYFDLAQAWYSLLAFHEHTADAGGGWPGYFSRWDADWSNMAHYSAALNGFSGTEQVFRRAITAIAAPDQVPWLANPTAGNSDTATIVVYNGLSWPRSGPVEAERFPSPLREGPLAVTDNVTGEPVPYEDVPGTRRHILFFAKSVPGDGYRSYSVHKSSEAAPKNSKSFPLEVSWDAAGSISGIRERATGRQMVQSNADKPFGSVFTGAARNIFRLRDNGAAEVKTSEGPVTRRIEIERKGSALPLTTVMLYGDAPYADLRFDVDLDKLRGERGSVAIALPLAGTRELVLDGAGFVIRVPRDFLPGGEPPQFAPVQFVHQQQADEWGVTLANRDTTLLKPGMLYLVANEDRPAPTRDEGIQRLYRTEPRSSPVQSFRFRIGVQEEDAAKWKRFGAECNLPLRSLVVDGKPSQPERGFFEVNDPRVQLLAFKPAEARAGWYVLRFQENGGKGAQGVRLTTPFRLAGVVRASTVEQPGSEKIDLSNFSLRPWETLTVLARIE
jgi:hypothetical protein